MNALPPMTPPRPNVASTIDWDRPVGNSSSYGHAASVLALLGR